MHNLLYLVKVWSFFRVLHPALFHKFPDLVNASNQLCNRWTKWRELGILHSLNNVYNKKTKFKLKPCTSRRSRNHLSFQGLGCIKFVFNRIKDWKIFKSSSIILKRGNVWKKHLKWNLRGGFSIWAVKRSKKVKSRKTAGCLTKGFPKWPRTFMELRLCFVTSLLSWTLLRFCVSALFVGQVLDLNTNLDLPGK